MTTFLTPVNSSAANPESFNKKVSSTFTVKEKLPDENFSAFTPKYHPCFQSFNIPTPKIAERLTVLRHQHQVNTATPPRSSGETTLLAGKFHMDSCSQQLLQCTFPTPTITSATGSKSSIKTHRKYPRSCYSYAEWDRLAGRRDTVF